MTEITPTVGRIVLYRLSKLDVEQIGRRRHDAKDKMDWHRLLKTGAQVHVGNSVSEGQIFPGIVVATWGDGPGQAINIQVFLDGTDVFWATSRHVGEQPGDYHWMTYQKGQAAKAEALEAKLTEKTNG
jgi:hypothetical protein